MQKLIIAVIVILVICGCNDADKKKPSERSLGPSAAENFRSSDPEPEIKKKHSYPSSAAQKRKKRHPKKTFAVTQQEMPAQNRDSVRLAKIEWLRKNRIEIDINEPGSRKFLFNGIDNIADHPFSIVSREKFLRINFDNDILDNTDHFYTNGIRLDLVNNNLRAIPLHYLMLPYWRHGINYYGIALTQNMYTPSTTKLGGVLHGDRPYAAYLCLSYYKISNDPRHYFRQTSELFIGILGPSSGGDFVQTTFHNSVPTNSEPLGWQYQVQNDLVLDYKLAFEKGIFEFPTFDLNINGTGEFGTLYDYLSGGISLRTGLMNPYFSRLWITPKQVNQAIGFSNREIYFFLKANAEVVGYDATLQGGMFNHSSVYTIPNEDISRFMFNGSAGVTLSMGGIRMDVEQFLISPEFHNGWWHKWVHIGLTFCL